MNRPAARLAAALLALIAAVVLLAVTAAGFVGLIVALVLTEPLSHGRITAATITTAGLSLLVLAQVLDRHAVPHAVDRSRTVTAALVVTVATAGRR